MSNINQVAYFALHRLIGSQVGPIYREFLELERRTPEYVRQLQAERTESLLPSAAKNVRYYRERVGIRTGLSLTDFPILTKEEIRDNFADLMTPDLRSEFEVHRKRWAYSWIAVQSGGSTGMPTTVIHGREFRDRGRAARLYSQYLSGFPLGTAYFRLWGSMREINSMRDSPTHRAAAYFAKERLLNAFKMEAHTIESYIEAINRSRIQFMMAYVDAAFEIARYALAKKRTLRPLTAIMACAGTVTEEARETIAAAFGARIHNKYGSRDCAEMACECEHGGLHEYSNNVVIEVVDEKGMPVPDGHSGRLLVTLLGNVNFPLIRYEIGDVGSLKSGLCRCGRPMRLLGFVEGRTVEFLLTTAGGYVSPTYIRHLIGVVHNPGIFRRYQVVQHAIDAFDLNLELESGAQPEEVDRALANIRRDFNAVFGPSAKIQTKFFDRIPPSASGKFLLSVCAIKNRHSFPELSGRTAT